jgi:hypothetical protein
VRFPATESVRAIVLASRVWEHGVLRIGFVRGWLAPPQPKVKHEANQKPEHDVS